MLQLRAKVEWCGGTHALKRVWFLGKLGLDPSGLLSMLSPSSTCFPDDIFPAVVSAETSLLQTTFLVESVGLNGSGVGVKTV